MKGVEVSAGQAAGGNLEEREKNVKRKRMSRPWGDEIAKRNAQSSERGLKGLAEGVGLGQLK